MRKSSKFIVVAGTVAALAVPSVAMADAPNGTYTWKAPQQGQGHGNTVAVDSSQVTQNGPAVSAQAQAGERAAIVQGLPGH